VAVFLTALSMGRLGFESVESLHLFRAQGSRDILNFDLVG
jgi:hypothetical protein